MLQKREADIECIKQESGEFHKDSRVADSVDDVKEVALRCEKRIKEFKVCGSQRSYIPLIAN